MTYYKFLQANGVSPYAGHPWPLPTGTGPGEWVEVAGDLVPCENGIHACRTGDLFDWFDCCLYEIEFEGEVHAASNKVYGRKARLLRRVSTWNERSQRLFAADCAEHVSHLWVAPEGCDWQPSQTLNVVRRYANGKASGRELDAARDATWAARDAACAAWATCAACAACAATCDAWATWAAERSWQPTKLLEYLEIEE